MTSSLTSPTHITANEHESASHPKKPRVCRYFSNSGFCRAGKECPFLHDESKLPGAPVTNKGTDEMAGDSEKGPVIIDGMVQDRRQVTKSVPASRVVQKPVPKAQSEDPRAFQLGQIRRRFNPSESVGMGQATLLKFNLTPSDPDFPFEMTALNCHLYVPNDYPKTKPSLVVGNKDIPKGFSLNVQSGFDGLVKEKPESTLLELMKALDKNLEVFLSAPKADTVKLVPNKDTRHLSLPSRSVEPAVSYSKSTDATASKPEEPSLKPAPTFTDEEKAQAAKKREIDTRQLEARMGRLPLFKKSHDGIAYTIPVDPRRRPDLPVALQAIKSVQLFVPLLYPLQPCRIQLDGVDSIAAKPVEKGFEQKAISQKDFTLMGHINYLVQNMHILAQFKPEPEKRVVPPVQPAVAAAPEPKGKEPEGQQDPERSHIQYITRPPEWTVVDPGDISGTDSDVYSYDTEESTSEDEGGAGVEVKEELSTSPAQPAANPERGTALSFPFIELYGIEILEITTLNLTVKCERCRESTEIKGLKSGVPKNESCRKCATSLTVGYRSELVHAHNVRAGFLDLEGCVVGDMLPSTFLPTCSTCSTTYPAPGIVSVRGETTSNICRECHQKFTFLIPQVKLLRITSSHLPPVPGPRRKKEVLGLQTGTELPKRGRCRHYAKSYRWFRFSCCGKVYACDRCHDEGEEHVNEWANRMICGFCSREGNYRPEDCGFCHCVLVGKKSGRFWEGGKGTRDRVRMSRKDKRKHRRIGGTTTTANPKAKAGGSKS